MFFFSLAKIYSHNSTSDIYRDTPLVMVLLKQSRLFCLILNVYLDVQPWKRLHTKQFPIAI